VPAKFPKEKPQKMTAKSGSSFAAFKGGFIDARQYFISLVVALGAFIAFKAFVVEKLGWPECIAWLSFVPPVIVFPWKTVPRLIEWRHKRSFIKGSQKDATTSTSFVSAASYFLIGPYGEERCGKYARADGMHITVLDWLHERILILTGSSGTGKSSLLNAFVIPALRESKPQATVQGATLLSFRRPARRMAGLIG
jgi:hypothetical protein